MQAPPALKNSTKPTQAPATVPSTTNSYTARFQKSRCLNDTTSTKTKRLTSDMFNSQCSELARSQSINKSIPKEPYSSQNSQQFYYQSDKASTTVSYKAPLAFNPSSVKLKSNEVSSPNNRLNEGQKLMKPSESVVKPTGIDSNSTSPLSERRSSSRSPLPHQEYKYKDSYTSRNQGVNSKPQTAICNEERSTSLIVANSSQRRLRKRLFLVSYQTSTKKKLVYKNAVHISSTWRKNAQKSLQKKTVRPSQVLQASATILRLLQSLSYASHHLHQIEAEVKAKESRSLPILTVCLSFKTKCHFR